MRRFVRRRGFTDRLYFLNLTLTWVFVWACVVIVLFSGKLGVTDTSALSTAISCAFGELSIHTGFVVWKAKTENMAKHSKKGDIDNDIEIIE